MTFGDFSIPYHSWFITKDFLLSKSLITDSKIEDLVLIRQSTKTFPLNLLWKVKSLNDSRNSSNDGPYYMGHII